MTTDPVERAMVLARTYDAVMSGERAPVAPRSLVSESWARSLDAHVDPDRGAATHVLEQAEIVDMRGAHPLAPAMALLRETLLGVADEARHMMIVTDEHGHILWRDGSRDVLRRGDRAGLVEGTRWSEDTVGTNAMGTALAADSAVTIHSAEHLVRGFHCWTCAAAPIHDPEDGRLIGVVDVTGPVTSFHPATLALVVAAARLAENHLATLAAARDERMRARNLGHLIRLRDEPGALLTPQGRVLAAHPAGWLPDRVDLPDLPGGSLSLGEQGEAVLEPLTEGWLLRLRRPGHRMPPTLGLPFLGADRPSALFGERRVRLTQRHAELLTLLALHPGGRSADQLAADLHGDAGKAVTVRAEMHRLRVALDAGVVRTQPYRLQARVDADFLHVRDAIAAGQLRRAAELYRGPLLPSSDAPGVLDEREQLAAALRHAVLNGGDVEALWTFSTTEEGAADPEVARRLLADLPAGDARRAAVRARMNTRL